MAFSGVPVGQETRQLPATREGKWEAACAGPGVRNTWRPASPDPAFSLPATLGLAPWGTTLLKEADLEGRGPEVRKETALSAVSNRWEVRASPVQPQALMPGARCHSHQALFFPGGSRPSIPWRAEIPHVPSSRSSRSPGSEKRCGIRLE